MKSLLALFFGLMLTFTVAIAPAAAADTAHGAQIFASNCTACHIGGNNVVNRAKTLKLEDLEKYDMASVEAIQNQVTRGKNAMPAFLGRLTPSDIEDVAAYVLDQAEKGW